MLPVETRYTAYEFVYLACNRQLDECTRYDSRNLREYSLRSVLALRPVWFVIENKMIKNANVS